MGSSSESASDSSDVVVDRGGALSTAVAPIQQQSQQRKQREEVEAQRRQESRAVSSHSASSEGAESVFTKRPSSTSLNLPSDTANADIIAQQPRNVEGGTASSQQPTTLKHHRSLWDRLRAKAAAHALGVGPTQPDESLAYVHGANVLLEDLSRPSYLGEEGDTSSSSGEGASLAKGPNAASQGSGEETEGWVGTPDPAKYAPGTNYLPTEELDEQVAAGHVARLSDIRQQIRGLNREQLKVLHDVLVADHLNTKVWARLPNGEKVSMWQLHQYVNENPELKELASRARVFDVVSTSASSQQAQEAHRSQLLPWELNPGAEQMELPWDVERHLPWGLLAESELWQRRPTRWLKGVDGVLDWRYAAYAHEPDAEKALGARWSGRNPQHIVDDPDYAADVLAKGPQMGMTFMLHAARELPYEKAHSALIERLTKYTQRHLPQISPAEVAAATAADLANDSDALEAVLDDLPPPAAYHTAATLAQLSQSLGLARLQRSNTRLLDPTGMQLRAGARLLLTAGPSGSIFVQATSPGTVREQESYIVASVHDETLCAALIEMFIGPDAMDKDFASQVRMSLLGPANGLYTNNANENPNWDDPTALARMPRAPSRPSAYHLPRLGSKAPALLLDGIGYLALAHQMQNVFSDAASAADAAGTPAEPDAEASGQLYGRAARRQAAENAIREGFATLGIDVPHISLASHASHASHVCTEEGGGSGRDSSLFETSQPL